MSTMLHAATGGRVATGAGYCVVLELTLYLLKGFKGKMKCFRFPDVIWDCRNTGESCTTLALRFEGYICVGERGMFDHMFF